MKRDRRRTTSGITLGLWPYGGALVAVPGAPIITSPNTNSVAENATLGHSLAANEPVTWAIRTAAQNAASVDHDKFELSGSTLRWVGNGTKDFEAPDDTGTNNTYVVVVRATDVDEGLTTDQTITITVTDQASTPTAFTFTDVTNATGGTVYESNTITVAGLADTAAVTITGGEYSKNGGAYASSATTAVNGDTFKVRHTSSTTGSTATNTVLTIGGVSDTYTTTTAATPTTPVLTWTSGTDDYDPTFSLTQIAENDVVAIEIDDVNTFTSLFDSDTNTIDSAEALSGSLTFAGISTLTDGVTFYARARYQRSGIWSAWSNIESKAMDPLGGSFSPSSVTPTLWYDPSDLSTLWQDAARTTPVTADGDPVRVIDDKSGNGYHLSAPSDAERPIYNTSGGLHWLTFNGTKWMHRATPFASISEATVAIAVRELVRNNSRMFLLSSGAGANEYGALSWSNDTIYFDAGSAAGARISVAHPWAVDTDAVLSFDDSVTNSRQFIRNDKVQVANDTSGETVTAAGDIVLGANSATGVLLWNHRFYGMVAKVGTVLTGTELGDVETWLGDKQGRTI